MPQRMPLKNTLKILKSCTKLRVSLLTIKKNSKSSLHIIQKTTLLAIKKDATVISKLLPHKSVAIIRHAPLVTTLHTHDKNNNL